MAQQKSNKNRKYGRSAKSTQNIAYKMENRKRKNKLRKLKALLKKQPNNAVVASRIKSIEANYEYGLRK